MDEFFDVVATATTVGIGVVAGLLFAFSVFGMRGLDRLGPEAAVAAMRSINIAIITPLFLLFWVGSAVGSLALVVGSPFVDGPTVRRVVAGALFLVGVIALTAVKNIPLNNELERTTAPANEAWAAYYGPWTRWNHVRTVVAIVATALLAA